MVVALARAAPEASAIPIDGEAPEAGAAVSTPAAETESSLTLEDLLTELRKRGWTLVRWGPLEAPELLAAMYHRATSADVFILRSKDDATAYRCPIIGDSPVFCPPVVAWQYHGKPSWTLREVLALEEPGKPGAPMNIEAPHPKCTIPPGLPKPVNIRPLRQNL
ncbi:hypothetical protein [Saccharopolyspora antimicrobica]|uniref:hypothetical protein n=1 Tax=Saccharopolyspora antimicrobica TaxID=455193 RepID=UPI001FE4F13A|nr:hypothetical protein [Saccharopolyspora antimicrobica]